MAKKKVALDVATGCSRNCDHATAQVSLGPRGPAHPCSMALGHGRQACFVFSPRSMLSPRPVPMIHHIAASRIVRVQGRASALSTVVRGLHAVGIEYGVSV